MTAEDIVKSIKHAATGSEIVDLDVMYMQLWDCIKGLVYLKASQRLSGESRLDDIEDVAQESYLAMPAAVKRYEQARGASFSTFFIRYYLPLATNRALYGSRTGKKDLLNSCISLDQAISGDDGDENLLIDLLADPKSQEPFLAIEEADYWASVDRYLLRGIDHLPPQQKTLISYLYKTGESCSKAHKLQIIGDSSRSYYGTVYRHALRNLRRWIEHKTAREAAELSIRDLFSNLYYRGTFKSFKNHGCSNVELIAIKNLEESEKVLRIRQLATYS